MVTGNVAQVPKHPACPEWKVARRAGQRIGGPGSWPCNSRAFASGGSIVVCFERGDDAVHKAGRLGGAAASRGVDSGRYAALGGDVGAGFDEDAVFSFQALPNTAGEMFCDERLGAFARTDSACVPVQTAEQEGFEGTADYRDHCGAIEGGGFDSVAVAASDGFAGDARGEGAAGKPGRSTRLGTTLQGMRGQQENDSARVSGRDE